MQSSDDLPPGWVRKFSDVKQKVFYVNLETKEKSWNHPYNLENNNHHQQIRATNNNSQSSNNVMQQLSSVIASNKSNTIHVSNNKNSKSNSEWEELFSEKYSKIFWKNRSTGETTWVNPIPVSQSEELVIEEPPVWEEFFSQLLKAKFWLNVVTNEITWKDPLLHEYKQSPQKQQPQWIEVMSEKYKKVFWKNTLTGEKTWHNPRSNSNSNSNLSTNKGMLRQSHSLMPPTGMTSSTGVTDNDDPVSDYSISRSGSFSSLSRLPLQQSNSRSQPSNSPPPMSRQQGVSTNNNTITTTTANNNNSNNNTVSSLRNMFQASGGINPNNNINNSTKSTLSLTEQNIRNHTLQQKTASPIDATAATTSSSYKNNSTNNNNNSSVLAMAAAAAVAARGSGSATSANMPSSVTAMPPPPPSRPVSTQMHSPYSQNTTPATFSSSGSANMISKVPTLQYANHTNNNTSASNAASVALAPYRSPTVSPRGCHVVQSYGGYSQRGNPDADPLIAMNKDAFMMVEDAATRSLFVCVMDGHGKDGHKITRYIQTVLAEYIFKHDSFHDNIPAAIWDGIEQCETELREDASIDTDYSGTTLTCLVIRDNTCILANIGDSGTALAYRNEMDEISALRLTVDHKPELPSEKQRIESSGGKVYAENEGDAVQIWMHTDFNTNLPLIPVLPLSRSVCNNVAKAVGVVSEPEFFSYTFHNNGKEDLVLVMGSDGLWAFMSDNEVMAVAVGTSDPAEAVNGLLKMSQERWLAEEFTADDITICVIYINNKSQSALIASSSSSSSSNLTTTATKTASVNSKSSSSSLFPPPREKQTTVIQQLQKEKQDADKLAAAASVKKRLGSINLGWLDG